MELKELIEHIDKQINYHKFVKRASDERLDFHNGAQVALEDLLEYLKEKEKDF